MSVVSLNGPPLYGVNGLELTTAVPPIEAMADKILELVTEPQEKETACQNLFRAPLRVGQTTAPPRTDFTTKHTKVTKKLVPENAPSSSSCPS